MTTGFISYTHADTALKEELVRHLAPLQREGLIDLWHDGMLRPGEHLDPAVQAALAASDVVILLVSAGFIASDYCYEQEMLRAFARQREGTARVIPIILKPCQWKGVPIGKGETLSAFIALPKDGKAVINWPDTDTAFDNAVGSIRDMIKAGGSSPQISGNIAQTLGTSARATRPAGSSNLLGISTKPTDLDRDRFLRSGFTTTAALFEEKLAELKASDLRIDTDFEQIDSRSFAASVYFDGNRVGQVSIWHGSQMWRNALCLSYDTATSSRSSMNDCLPIEDTPHGLAFGVSATMSRRLAEGPLDAAGAAAYFWENFLEQVRSRIR